MKSDIGAIAGDEGCDIHRRPGAGGDGARGAKLGSHSRRVAISNTSFGLAKHPGAQRSGQVSPVTT